MSAKSLRTRLLLVGCIIVGCWVAVWPPHKQIRLGLDLRGGIRLTLQIDSDQAVQERLQRLREMLESGLLAEGIGIEGVTLAPDHHILIQGMADEGSSVLHDHLKRLAAGVFDLNCQQGRSGISCRLALRFDKRQQWIRQAAEQVRAVLSRRIDQYGILEPSIALSGGDGIGKPLRILLEIPGEQDVDRILGLISATGKLEYRLLHTRFKDPFASRSQAIKALGDQVADGFEVVAFRAAQEPDQPRYFILHQASVLSGEDLTDARPSRDPWTGGPEVDFFLTEEGRQRFSRTTAEHVGESLAVVLDGEAVTVAQIKEPIPTASVRIDGLSTHEEAADLALMLRSGSLPAPVQIADQHYIGPSLGLDSIRKGMRASLLALALVVACMLVVYRSTGLIAIACLAVNLGMLMGVLAAFQRTLTLAGIAGIALTVGMAVDAHILIFERVREELRAGSSLRVAVQAGHRLVWRTLMDTNLTTLMAAFFLFQFGSGSLRGFAVTLSIGLLANLFTATFVSRTFYELMLRGGITRVTDRRETPSGTGGAVLQKHG